MVNGLYILHLSQCLGQTVIVEIYFTLVSSLITGGIEGLGHLNTKYEVVKNNSLQKSYTTLIAKSTTKTNLNDHNDIILNLMISLKACPMYMIKFHMRITLLPTAPSMFQNQKLTKTYVIYEQWSY